MGSCEHCGAYERTPHDEHCPLRTKRKEGFPTGYTEEQFMRDMLALEATGQHKIMKKFKSSRGNWSPDTKVMSRTPSEARALVVSKMRVINGLDEKSGDDGLGPTKVIDNLLNRRDDDEQFVNTIKYIVRRRIPIAEQDSITFLLRKMQIDKIKSEKIKDEFEAMRLRHMMEAL